MTGDAPERPEAPSRLDAHAEAAALRWSEQHAADQD
jgi:hypothetical protein